MIIEVDRYGPFELQDDFLRHYHDLDVPWGFGALSWITFKRTYSRKGEKWWQTCRRVIEGMFTVQKVHCQERALPWDEKKARNFARKAYERMFQFKWTPPGRGLWMMGTQFMYDRGGAALNNCGFVSTSELHHDYAAPFIWMLRMSMLGVGVGFDTRGKGKVKIQRPEQSEKPFTIPDSREGWAEALGKLLSAYANGTPLPLDWDYSEIRPKGTPLESFGGIASGPEPLRRMLESLEELYNQYAGQKVDSRLIVDTMNIIGRCVVAGGIRRSAQVALGEADDRQFLDLKQDEDKVADYRWVSNNSILATVGMDYDYAAQRTIDNGEPGYLWLENARSYGRMKDAPNEADSAAMGTNPCVEQTLWDRELCCLVETYPAHHENLEDFKETLRVAFQYAKTVTLVPTQQKKTNAVMGRNRRIGCSMTGIVQAINRIGYRSFFRWCDKSYDFIQHLDAKYSDWLCTPRSIKTTSVKPSGTVSLLAGATPGVHWEHAPYYVRRVRVSENHPMVEMCKEAGYEVEPDRYADNTVVVSFPVHIEGLERSKSEVPLREKVDLAAQMQYYWSDNQVSITAEFDPESEGRQIPRILEAYENRLKALVFLPSREHGYEQPPYEEISKQKYEKMKGTVKPLQGKLEHEESLEARFCEGGICEATQTSK
ncbi:MAG: fused protease/ribonucleoside-triphosphate reductase [Candidatus Brocadiia bacterium]